MKKYFQILLIFISFHFFSLSVLAQSQTDVSVCDFSASDEKNLSIQLNYSCESTTWLPRTYEVYRKVNLESCDTKEYDTADFVKPNGDSMYEDGEYFVEDYMLKYEVADGSVRESISWFENEYRTNKDSVELGLENRKLPRPFLVTEDLANGSDILKRHEGFVMCPVYSIVGDAYERNAEIKTFVRADLVPPAAQELENIFIDAIYLIWGFVFIYGIIRLMYIGFQFIYGGTSPERLGELRASLMLWAFGLLLVILAVPFIAFIYSLVGINTTKCYRLTEGEETVYDLSLPGFTFFFGEVCTGEFAAQNTPTP